MRSDSVESESTYDWRRDGWLAACALTAGLLIISAATPHPPGFDTFLRMFVFCVALVRAFAGFRRGGAWLPLSAAVIALLFNPARPVEMSPAAWVWCDLLAAAWFAIVGAWQLLRSWDPQRGWAAAAISLGAVTVPAIAAMSAPSRDALTGMKLDENLAAINVEANSAAPLPETDVAAQTAVATAAPAAGSSAPVSHAAATAKHAPAATPVVNAPAFEPNNAAEAAAPSDSDTPQPSEVTNNMSEGNEE
jgi:hypothetical protein